MSDPHRSRRRPCARAVLGAALLLAACAPAPDPIPRFDAPAIAPRRGPAVATTEGACIARHPPGWFETPCPAAMTPDFVASLQRALAARDLYDGRASGNYDAATRAAVRAFQHRAGLDSDVIALATAKRFGLWPYSRADLAGR